MKKVFSHILFSFEIIGATDAIEGYSMYLVCIVPEFYHQHHKEEKLTTLHRKQNKQMKNITPQASKPFPSFPVQTKSGQCLP